jgi:hypothetical protein
MKLRFQFAAAIQIIACLFLTVLLAQTAAAIQLTNEFWISTNPSTNNPGTLDRPFDGSTAANFDLAMSNMPPNSVMHILAGTYQTKGWNPCLPWGWRLKTGQKILGSGIDATIIQEVANTPPGTHVMCTSNTCSGISYSYSNIEISDLTVDCNFNTNSHGITLRGTSHAIRRVKMINAASASTLDEVFLFQIDGNNANSEGNIIEECEVSNFLISPTGGACTAISMGVTNQQFFASGIIRNNRLFLQNSTNCMAINCGVAKNLLVEGNYINSADACLYAERTHSNLLVVANVFKNCNYGVFMRIWPQANLTFAHNNIQLSYAPSDEKSAFEFSSERGGSFTNVTIIGNTIGFDSIPPVQTSYSVSVPNWTGLEVVTGLVMANNAIAKEFITDFTLSTNLAIYDNTDLSGAFTTNLNQVALPNGYTRQTITGSFTAAYGTPFYAERAVGTTITLPLAAGHSGKEFIFANESGVTGNITIAATAPDKINGAASVILNGGYSAKIVTTDGVNWFAR